MDCAALSIKLHDPSSRAEAAPTSAGPAPKKTGSIGAGTVPGRREASSIGAELVMTRFSFPRPSEHDSEREPAQTTRRRFLALFVATGATVGARSLISNEAYGAESAAPSSLVWRLDSHWGYAVGPKHRTHCHCRTCVAHATNKVFASREAAESGRAHQHCVCEVRAVQIDPAGYPKLFDGQKSVDLRNPGIADSYSKLVVASH